MNHATTPGEKERMMRELDLTYRQAMALCPYSVETVKRYVNLLRDQDRLADARRMVKTGRMLNPRSKRLQELAEELKENLVFTRGLDGAQSPVAAVKQARHSGRCVLAQARAHLSG